MNTQWKKTNHYICTCCGVATTRSVLGFSTYQKQETKKRLCTECAERVQQAWWRYCHARQRDRMQSDLKRKVLFSRIFINLQPSVSYVMYIMGDTFKIFQQTQKITP